MVILIYRQTDFVFLQSIFFSYLHSDLARLACLTIRCLYVSRHFVKKTFVFFFAVDGYMSIKILRWPQINNKYKLVIKLLSLPKQF